MDYCCVNNRPRVHGRVSGRPVIPVGVCLGIDDSDGFTFISSDREGATSFGNNPLSERTYAAISHPWYSGIRLRKDGIPLGRPCMIVVKMFCGSLP
jgi:hypothetical protein